MKRQASFESFYYRKVGLGEGCGCAEKIIDAHEFERQAGPLRLPSFRPKFSWRRFWRNTVSAAGPRGEGRFAAHQGGVHC